jgi:hypothetical protein
MLIVAASPARASTPNQFRFHKEIDRGENAATEGLVAVPFDRDVCAAARDEFPDVRLFNAAGRETPFLIEKAAETRTHTRRLACPIQTLSFKEQEDGLEIIVERERESSPADGLIIFTPLKNFERRVQVFGSDDGVEWKSLVADGLVFDYARYMDVSNREIRLPTNDFRRLKVVVSGIADTRESPLLDLTRKYRGGGESERIERTVLERRPFRINHIELWAEKTETLFEHEKQVDCPLALVGVTEDAKEKTTVVDLLVRRVPLTELTMETPSRNFSRAVEARRPAEKETGRPETPPVVLAAGRVSQVEFGGYCNRMLSVALPECRPSRLEIVIRNEDGPPLKISGVMGRGPQYQAVFLAAAGETYQLAYGADHVASPRYDVAAVLAPLRLRGTRPIECRLGPETVGHVALVDSSDSMLKALLNSPLFMGGIVVALVIVLGWAMFRAARRINEISKE